MPEARGRVILLTTLHRGLTNAMKPVEEQTILITGSTSGHGRALAELLAGEGATILLHGRRDDLGEQAVREISAATGNDGIRFYRADFSSLDEVRDLAARVQEDNEKLDCLVNNAGIGVADSGGGGRMISRDGYELRFQVNYLAPYLLTRLLLPLLVDSAPARIVNVSSAGQASIDFNDPMLEHRYDGLQAYGQSKLAQVMDTIELSAELDPEAVTVNCLHPATYMDTEMIRLAGVNPASTVGEGAEATLRLVTESSLDGTSGLYFDHAHESAAHSQAYDEDARTKLMVLSRRLTGA
jgi:NAD(P)-dependent dehydrogenase (short-subunit alcohol dehydrogenase family)